ncbi:MAG: hypothetical protein PHU80_05760 [Kiritimatiellae bacterium]|nr:hypothetical protein [Kiritimatiellia bacterium]
MHDNMMIALRKTRPASGFTLVEFVFASSLALLLFMVMLEALFFCRRNAALVKGRLAADAFAYDLALDLFNRKTEWFEQNASTNIAEWFSLPPERTSAWSYSDRSASAFYWIAPSGGTPPSQWTIVTDVQWPLAGGGWARLNPTNGAAPIYQMERRSIDRNLFRNTP